MMKSGKRRQRHYYMLPLTKIKELEPLKEESIRYERVPRRSVSCPCILPSQAREKVTTLPWTRSAIFSTTQQHCHFKAVLNQHFNKTQIRAMSTQSATPVTESLNTVKKLGSVCACPGPCAPCSSGLPPPCNTPAKCLQYMHGYYYYPYGTWFCGPYHVSTGACGPCSGPVRPGGPCCPAAPCPGGPCGPVGVSPCGPCGPCSPGCSCGPLGCCGVCGVGPHQTSGSSYPGPHGPHSYASGQFTTAYNSCGPFGPFASPNQFNPYQTYNPWNQNYNPPAPYVPFNNEMQFAGPFYNVPCQIPVQVNNAASPPGGKAAAPPPSQSHSPTRKCCVVWPLPKTEPMDQSVHPIYPTSPPPPRAESPCPKNLHPKSLRLSAPSRFDINPTINRRPVQMQKPRYNARAMDQIKLTQACLLPTNMYPISISNDIIFKSIFNAASKLLTNAEKSKVHEKGKRS